MFRTEFIQLGAALSAFSGLLTPFLGRFVSQQRQRALESATKRISIRSLALLLLLSSLLCLSLFYLSANAESGRNVTTAALLSLACGVGIIADRIRLGFRGQFAFQALLSITAAAVGGRIEVTQGAVPILDVLFTAIFIIGIINAMAALNFMDGFGALAAFLASSCLAILFGVTTTDQAGLIFSLFLSGASLAFFLMHRPSAVGSLSDIGVMLLNTTLALLVIRAWNAAGAGVEFPPAFFLPMVLILPILLAGVHREQMTLRRRMRITTILIVAGHLPSWIPVALSADLRMPAVLTAVGSTILWTALITQRRPLRGWSLRVMAEPIADILRVAALTVALTTLASVVMTDPVLIVWSVGSSILTTALLIAMVYLWRKRASTNRMPDVIILGSAEEFRRVAEVVNRCGDLIGRRKLARCRINARSKHAPPAVRNYLRRGLTVLILDDDAGELAELRSYGDLVFATDCVLLRELLDRYNHVADYRFPFGEVLHNVVHRLIALVALIVLMPVWLAVAILIKLDDGGPIFFRQRRLGHNGRRFTLYKFRSMRVDAPRYGESPREKVDPRVTRIGRIIRKLSLDEIPQLFNVIKGDMRLVGPRPEMPFICAQYSPDQRRRLDIPPGVTGLWQISPHRNEPIHEHVEYDLAYRGARGPILDLAIMISTLLGGVKTGY